MVKIVEMVDVSKIFKDFWGRPKVKAVQSLNLDIKEGEVFGLLGPNGSGKSTTIKMLLGLLKPTSGQIAIFGQHTRHSDIKSKIGFLPEESYLYSFLTGEEALHFFGGLFGLSKGVRKNRVEELIQMVGLEHARNRRLGEYSKGMARRIGLAQALIGDPQLLILDEPTTGLDPLGILEIKELILALKKKGKTILLSSHLLSEVQDVCDRVCILYGGKVCSYGELNDLLVQKDKMSLELSQMTPKHLEQLSDWLKQNGIMFNLQQPKENLESYFMRVIRDVNAKETGGAVKSGGLPTFFSANEILGDLMKEELPVTLSLNQEEINKDAIVQLIEQLPKVKDPINENAPDVDRKLLDELTQKRED